MFFELTDRARARYKSLVVADIGRRLFITLLKLMEIYALDSRQDDKDNSRARQSHRARRLESYLNEIYVCPIPVVSGAINDSSVQ